MENLGYYNGKYDLIDNMTVPMNDRVCYFGDGVYDVTMCRNYIPYLMDDHIDRFYSSASLLKIEIPMSKEELKELLCGLSKKLDSHEQMMYWQVTRGTAVRSHAFPEGVKANLWVTLRPMKVKDMNCEVTLITVEDTRYLHCNIKTLNLIPNVMAEQEAKEKGADTAVFQRGKYVTECAHSNIHILKDGKIITHPADNLILPGIARKHILRLSAPLGIPVEERAFTLDEMFSADEVFVSSSTANCMRVTKIDGKAVGGKDYGTLHKLQEAFMNDYLKATEA